MFAHTIDLQQDFQLIRSDSLNSFVWVGRGYPYRWLTLHKGIKADYMDSNNAWNQLITEFNIVMPDIKISEKYRSVETINYNKTKHIYAR